ncbi:MAG TPA: amidohydrolase family protein, partial [Stellaceae bacterium]|nr:amidohydrolase family protein [Stellaceae bacterium]
MLLIRGGQVLLENATELQALDILVERDRITELGVSLPAPDGARVIDAANHITLPGLINCHTHAHNNLLKGFEDNRTLEEARAYGPVLYANRTIDDQYVSAAIGAIEMVKTGCTTAFDMFTAMPAMTD